MGVESLPEPWGTTGLGSGAGTSNSSLNVNLDYLKSKYPTQTATPPPSPTAWQQLPEGTNNVFAGGSQSQADMLMEQGLGLGGTQADMIAEQNAGFDSSPSTNSSAGGGSRASSQSVGSIGGSSGSIGSEAFPNLANTVGGTTEDPAAFNDYRVKLVNAQNQKDRVVFLATPDLTESREVAYKAVEPVHMPGQIWAYTNTQSRTFQIGARFFCRNSIEASAVLLQLQLLRAWTMPFFGASRGGNASAGEILGAPPPVLFLSAYSSNKVKSQLQLKQIPVYLRSYNIPFTAEVDYVPSGEGIPVPSFMQVDLTLVETHSPRGYEQFSLQMYKTGNLPYY